MPGMNFLVCVLHVYTYINRERERESYIYITTAYLFCFFSIFIFYFSLFLLLPAFHSNVFISVYVVIIYCWSLFKKKNITFSFLSRSLSVLFINLCFLVMVNLKRETEDSYVILLLEVLPSFISPSSYHQCSLFYVGLMVICFHKFAGFPCFLFSSLFVCIC